MQISNLQLVNISYNRVLRNEISWTSPWVCEFNTCARVTWFGHKADFKDFPLREADVSGAVSIQTGADAYEQLLKIKTGMDSPRFGEKNIAGQMVCAMNQLKSQSPETYNRMSQCWQILTADARYIRANFLDKLQKATPQNAARLLSGVKKDDIALIVGATGRRLSVTQATIDMMHTLGSRITEIFYTAANFESLDAITARFQTQDTRKSIPTFVRLIPVPIEKIGDTIGQGAHVFVDHPMGDEYHTDNILMSQWKARSNDNGAGIVHLRGSPKQGGQSTKLWRGSDLERYFSPERVKEKTLELKTENERIAREAAYCVSILAQQRAGGERAHTHKILNATPLPLNHEII